MYIITPNICYNLNHYSCVYNSTDDKDDRCLYLEKPDGTIDTIQFDCPGSAIRAFDAVTRGLANGHKTLYMQEIYLRRAEDDIPSLQTEYDKGNKSMIEKETKERIILADPRHNITI